MPKYVTQDWCDMQRTFAEFPERPGVTARIQYHVTDGPEGDIKYHWLLENGSHDHCSDMVVAPIQPLDPTVPADLG